MDGGTHTGLTFEEATHTYRWDGQVVPSVTQILAPGSSIARLDPRILAAAAQLGTDVHAATAFDDRGVLDPETVDETVLPYLEAWRAFRELEHFIPCEIEQRVYSRQYSYAGTFDRNGNFPKFRALLDIKSGARDATHAPQTAAYAECVSTRIHRASVYLRPGKSPPYEIDWHHDPADFSVFLAFLAVHRFKEKHGVL